MDQAKLLFSILREMLWISTVCMFLLSRNAASSSLSPSVGCSSDLDCSLNGRCVLPSSSPPPLHPSTKVCVCDKPWSGNHCETLVFKPIRGKKPTDHSGSHRTAASSIAPQGYGMLPNTTSWGGGILVESIGPGHVLYHLYVSRMTNDCLLEHWTTNSRIDHAISTSIMGPYEFVGVAIPTFSHNPAPVELYQPTNPQWRYAMFHLGNGTKGENGGKDCRSNDHSIFHEPMLGSTNRRQTRQGLRDTPSSQSSGSTIHVSNSLYGPWMPLRDHNMRKCNNPAPWVHPANGTLYVLCSNGGHRSFLFKSQDGNVAGPYEPVTEFHAGEHDAQEVAYEDPCLYTDPRGNFHVLYHAYRFAGSPEDCTATRVSAHVYSEDGLDWHTSPIPPYGSQIGIALDNDNDDGNHDREKQDDDKTFGTVTLATRERPKLVINSETGWITHMVEGVCGAPSCDPAPHNPFCVECKYGNWDFTLVSALEGS